MDQTSLAAALLGLYFMGCARDYLERRFDEALSMIEDEEGASLSAGKEGIGHRSTHRRRVVVPKIALSSDERVVRV